MNKSARRKMAAAVEALRGEAITLLQDLIRIPSVNHPPHGDEKAVQEFYHGWLRRRGVDCELVEPTATPGFASHPARLAERDMAGRPNVTATLKGSGGGRSLLVLAHADTEAVGDLSAWHDDPFGGTLRGGRVHGRGAGDDKSGMAAAAILPLALRHAGVRLRGDLTIAAVADEEQGGANGSAALLASGVTADAALYLDGTADQAIWNAGLGGGFAEITVKADAAAVAFVHQKIAEEKEAIKRRICASPAFGERFFNSSLAKQFSFVDVAEAEGGDVKLAFFLDTLPGDDEAALKKDFEDKCQLPAGAAAGLSIKWMSRFLKPALLEPTHPLVSELGRAFELATGRPALVAPGCQSDQGIISHYGGIPCVLFGCGRRGKAGAPHLPNEHIVIDEFMENLLTTALFAVDWCGTAN